MTNRFSQLRWEITAALVLKVALLCLLWKICFSHPVGHSVNTLSTTHHILNNLKGNSHGS